MRGRPPAQLHRQRRRPPLREGGYPAGGGLRPVPHRSGRRDTRSPDEGPALQAQCTIAEGPDRDVRLDHRPQYGPDALWRPLAGHGVAGLRAEAARDGRDRHGEHDGLRLQSRPGDLEPVSRSGLRGCRGLRQGGCRRRRLVYDALLLSGILRTDDIRSAYLGQAALRPAGRPADAGSPGPAVHRRQRLDERHLRADPRAPDADCLRHHAGEGLEGHLAGIQTGRQPHLSAAAHAAFRPDARYRGAEAAVELHPYADCRGARSLGLGPGLWRRGGRPRQDGLRQPAGLRCPAA